MIMGVTSACVSRNEVIGRVVDDDSMNSLLCVVFFCFFSCHLQLFIKYLGR